MTSAAAVMTEAASQNIRHMPRVIVTIATIAGSESATNAPYWLDSPTAPCTRPSLRCSMSPTWNTPVASSTAMMCETAQAASSTFKHGQRIFVRAQAVEEHEEEQHLVDQRVLQHEAR